MVSKKLRWAEWARQSHTATILKFWVWNYQIFWAGKYFCDSTNWKHSAHTTNMIWALDPTNGIWATDTSNGIVENEKGHVPDDPDPDPSLSSSSSKKNKRDKKKKCRKHRKDDFSYPSSSDYSDSSNDNDYRCKLLKSKSDQEKYLIQLCARLTAKLLTTAYKTKIIRFKMDEDTLQRRIYFLKFGESLIMIFS